MSRAYININSFLCNLDEFLVLRSILTPLCCKFEASDEIMAKVQHQFQEVKIDFKTRNLSKKSYRLKNLCLSLKHCTTQADSLHPSCAVVAVHLNPFSTGTQFYLQFGYNKMILVTLGKLYGGQKINGQRFCYSNPFISFWVPINRDS